jgi:hypothetical protein
MSWRISREGKMMGISMTAEKLETVTAILPSGKMATVLLNPSMRRYSYSKG